MAPQPARPGNRSRVIGTLSLQLTTEGSAEATRDVNRLQTVAQALMKTNAKMLAKRSPVEVLAADSALAAKALGGLQRGALEKFTSWLTKNNEGIEDRIQALNKLEKAYIKSIKAGEPIFEKEQYEALLKQREEYENINDQVEDGGKGFLDWNVKTDIFKKLLGDAAAKASELFGHIINGFKDAIPLEEDAKAATDALAAGFKVAGKMALAFAGVTKKVFSTLWSGVTKSGGGFKKAFTGMFNITKAVTTGLMWLVKGGLAIVLLKVVAVTAAVMGLIAVLALVIPPLGMFIATVGALVVAFKLAMDGIKKIVALQDEFRTSTFRSMGSISELTKATAELGSETRLGIDANLDSIKAMNEAGISAGTLSQGFVDLSGKTVTGVEALKASAAEITRLHHITGIAHGEIAQFQKTMIALTGTSWQASAAMMTMVKAQKVYGLTAKDITKTMQTIVKLQSSFRITLNKTNLAKFNKGMLELQGAAKRVGVPLEEVNRLVQDVSENMDKFFVTAAMGGKLSEFINTNDLNARMQAVEAGALRMLKNAERMSGYQREVYLKMTGLSKDQLLIIKARNMELTKEEKARLKILKRQEAQKKVTQEFNKASQSLIQQLKMIFTPLISEAAKGVQGFVEELTKMGNYVQDRVQPLWQKLGKLIQEIFGVKFAESDDMKATIDKIVKAFENIVDKAREMVKEGKKFLKSVIAGAQALAKTYQKVKFGVKTVGEATAGDWLKSISPFKHKYSWQIKAEKAHQAHMAKLQRQYGKGWQKRLKDKRDREYAEYKRKKALGLLKVKDAKKAEDVIQKAQKKTSDEAKKILEDATKDGKKAAESKIKYTGTYGKALKDIYRARGLDVDKMKMFQKSTVNPKESSVAKARANAVKDVAKARAAAADAEPVPGVVISSKSKTEDKSLLAANKTQAELLAEIYVLLKEMNDKVTGEEQAQITEPKSRRGKPTGGRKRTLRT